MVSRDWFTGTEYPTISTTEPFARGIRICSVSSAVYNHTDNQLELIKQLLEEEKVLFTKMTWKNPKVLGSPISKKEKKVRINIRNALN